MTAWKTHSPHPYRQQFETQLIEALIYYWKPEKVGYIQLNQDLTSRTAYQGSWRSGEIPLTLAKKGEDGVWRTDPKRIQPYVQRLRSLIAYCGKNSVRRGHGATTKSLPLFDKQGLEEELEHLAKHGHQGISPREFDKIRWVDKVVPTCKTGRKKRLAPINAEDMQASILEQERNQGRENPTVSDEVSRNNRQRPAQTQHDLANSDPRYATTGQGFLRPETLHTPTVTEDKGSSYPYRGAGIYVNQTQTEYNPHPSLFHREEDKNSNQGYQTGYHPSSAVGHPRAAAPPPRAPNTKDKIKHSGITREQIRSVNGTKEAHSLTTGDKGWWMNL
jgi:hypothetical protein